MIHSALPSVSVFTYLITSFLKRTHHISRYKYGWKIRNANCHPDIKYFIALALKKKNYSEFPHYICFKVKQNIYLGASNALEPRSQSHV